MFRAFRQLVERQIARTQMRGGLQGLKGEGKPLPEQSVGVDPALSSGLRIMAEAGVIPEEFVLKKHLDSARSECIELKDPAARKVKIAEIAELEMRYNMAVEARRGFLK